MMLSTDADDFRILRPLFNSPPCAGEGRRSIRAKNRGSRLVIAGLVPAIPIRIAQCLTIGMAGTSPAVTKRAATLYGTTIVLLQIKS